MKPFRPTKQWLELGPERRVDVMRRFGYQGQSWYLDGRPLDLNYGRMKKRLIHD